MSEGIRGDAPSLRESAGVVPAQLVRPFIEAAAGTSDFWADKRSITSLAYKGLTVGDLRALARSCSAALEAEAANEPTAWRCFHCNELFTDRTCAAEHFGVTEMDGPPACVQMLTEGEKAIVQSRREWQHRASTAEAATEAAEYLSSNVRWDINSRWRGLWTVAEVGHRFEDIEGRMLAAEGALNAAPPTGYPTSSVAAPNGFGIRRSVGRRHARTARHKKTFRPYLGRDGSMGLLTDGAIRHGETGRFVSPFCPDENCGGAMKPDVDRGGSPVWRCDGLTYEREDQPLFACKHELPRKP